MSKRPTSLIQPDAIEAESFRIIEAEMGSHEFSVLEWPIVQRAIHATADFELGRSMVFHPRAVEAGIAAIRKGADVVADVQMIQAGISAGSLAEFGGRTRCYMADLDVAEKARAEGTTRAIQCMRKAARQAPGAVYAIGNAPTALLELVRLVEDAEANPDDARPSSVTDADGRFAHVRVPAGKRTLSASNGAGIIELEVTVGPGQRTDLGVLRLDPAPPTTGVSEPEGE